VFCGVNNDPGAKNIRDEINYHLNTRGGFVDDSITHADYIALMQSAALVIGNSSAGIIEAPWIGVPTVNIGNRQDGRETAQSVFQSGNTVQDISKAIDKALSWKGLWEPVYCPADISRIVESIKECQVIR